MSRFLSRLGGHLCRAGCWLWRWRCRLVGAAVILVLAAAGYLYYDYRRDEPQAFFDNPVMQFKYGSTGGDRLAGIPIGIWNALPKLCRKYFPGEGWQSLGFIYEDGMSRPIGTSLRRSLGFDRIFLNCAACHVGTYRAQPSDKPVVVVGMPANHLQLGKLEKSLTDCALDESFNPWQVIQAAEDSGAKYSLFDRLVLQYVAVPAMRELLIFARFRFRFLDNEPESGPGRFDTFNPAKALLNWPLDLVPQREMIGIVDFPSVWNQAQREGMWLHWDGNNNSVEERNRSAAFGTGAVPTTLDRESLGVIADWLKTQAKPPPWPFAIDQARAARGKPLYETLLRRLPWEERHGLHRRAGRQGRAHRPYPHRSLPPRQLHPCPGGRAGQSLLRIPRSALPAFPQDRRLRQYAARRHLAARALSAQRVGADAARSARAGGEAAGVLLSRL